MKTTCTALFACALATPALAQTDDHRLGDHPAVVVQRLYANQGYDYVSKFYPHPAWLYLLPEPPRERMEHPAVIVHRREQQLHRAVADAAVRDAASNGKR